MKIIFALAFFYFAMIGWGRLLAWATCSRKIDLNNEIEVYHLFSWLGLPAIFIVASAYNWFFPISINFSRALLLIGLISFAHYLARHWRKLEFQDIAIFAAALTAGYWVQGREILIYDSLLYHIPAILWHQSEPVVLGLANLHGRFGFNPAWLTISSTFYFPGLGIRAVFLGQALLPMLLIGFILKQIAATKLASLRLYFFFFATLAGLLGTRPLQNALRAATSNDTVAVILVIMSAFLFVSLLDRFNSDNSDKTKPHIELLTLCTLSVLAIMTKLSAAPLAIFIIAFLITGRSFSGLPKISSGMGGGLALMSVLWVAQNFALSGCLVYPVSFTCTSSVDWGVGGESAKQMADVITAWARHPGPQYMTSLGNFDWIRDYYVLNRGFFHELLLFTLLVILFAVYLCMRFLKAHHQVASSRRLPFDGNPGMFYWIPVSVCLAGLVLWAVAAPDPRFALGFFVLLPSSIAYLLFTKAQIHEFGMQSALLKKRVFVAVLLVSAVLFSLLLLVPPRPDNLEKEFSDARLSPPMIMKATHSGVNIQIPATGADCAATSPPCTPSFSDALGRESFLWLSMWKITK